MSLLSNPLNNVERDKNFHMQPAARKVHFILQLDYSYLPDLVEVKKLSTSCAALEDFLCQKNIDTHLQYIDACLANKEFSQFSINDIQANLLLLLCRFAQLKEPNDLALIFRIVPYYIMHLGQDSMICPIISADIIQALKSSSSQIIHALDHRVHDFIKNNPVELQSKGQEWINIVALLTRIVEIPPPFAMDSLGFTLAEWRKNSNTSIDDFGYILRTLSDFSYALSGRASKQITLVDLNLESRALFRSFCLHEPDPDVRSMLLLAVAGYSAVLQDAVTGVDVDESVEYLASILFGEQPHKFNNFSSGARLACILLLLYQWSETGKTKYLDLLLYAFSYCFDHIEEIDFKVLTKATEQSINKVKETLKSLINDFQDDRFQNRTGHNDFKTFISRIPISSDISFITQTVAAWHRIVKPDALQTAARLQFYAEFLCRSDENQKNIRKTVLDLLDALAQVINNDEAMLQVLCVLHNSDAKPAGSLNWTEKLTKREFKSFVNLVCGQTCPLELRKSFIQYYLRPDAHPNSLMAACHFVPYMEEPQLKVVLDTIDARGSDDCLKEYIAGLRHVATGAEIEAQVLNHFCSLPNLMRRLEDAVIKDPDHWGVDFFLDTVDSAKFPDEDRKQLILRFLSQENAEQCLLLAIRSVKPCDTIEISQIMDRFQAIILNEPDSQIAEQFYHLLDYNYISQALKDQLINYCLNKKNPASVLVVVRMCSTLSFSAIWHLLHQIKKISEHARISKNMRSYLPLEQRWQNTDSIRSREEQFDKDLKCALQTLLSVSWHRDIQRFNGDPTWFKVKNIQHFWPCPNGQASNSTLFFQDLRRQSTLQANWYTYRAITFYTVEDSGVQDLSDTLEKLSIVCSLDVQKSREQCLKKVNASIEKLKSRKRSKDQAIYPQVLKNCHLQRIKSDEQEAQAEQTLQMLSQMQITAAETNEYEQMSPESPEPTEDN